MSLDEPIVVNTVDSGEHDSDSKSNRDTPPSPTHSIAETVAETVAETKRGPMPQKRAKKITSIKNVQFSETLERMNDTYIAKLAGGEPLCILTPPIILKDSIRDEEGDVREYVTMKLKRVYGDLFGVLEDTLLQTAKERKGLWFNNEDLDNDFLEKSLKRFYDTSSKCLTVRVDEDVGGRVDLASGTRVRCVLELHSAVFTRTQYGLLWTLTLVKGVGRQEDVYLFDPDEEPQHQSITTHDLMSCLVHRDLKSSPDEDVQVDMDG